MRTVLFTAACLATSGMPVLAETKDEICTAVSKAVGVTISARQDGISLDAVLNMADQAFPTGEVLDMAKGMIVRVYATVPVLTDESARSSIAEAYRSQVHAECMEKDF